MTSDAPRFSPQADSAFTPAADADLAADPETGQGPGGTTLEGAADPQLAGGEDGPQDVAADETGGFSEPPD